MWAPAADLIAALGIVPARRRVLPRMPFPRGALVALLAPLAVALGAGPAAAATPPPPGANQPCTPSTAHPYPVVLVHGTAESIFQNWQAMAPALKTAGYCVYAFNYGSGNLGVCGLNDIQRSAAELASEVDSALSRTGASKVDLVGHSQGGMMPRDYMKNLGGGSKVDDLVGLSPSNHGTTPPLAAPLGLTCPACAQQAAGSPFITQLNAGDETPGSADYTAIQITLNALGRSGPADPALRPACPMA
jgi:pimeloyl-ACP methyl ester carboxylesterase